MDTPFVDQRLGDAGCDTSLSEDSEEEYSNSSINCGDGAEKSYSGELSSTQPVGSQSYVGMGTRRADIKFTVKVCLLLQNEYCFYPSEMLFCI